MQLSSPYEPHVPPIPLFLIWLREYYLVADPSGAHSKAYVCGRSHGCLSVVGVVFVGVVYCQVEVPATN